jgi:hypothetical protein
MCRNKIVTYCDLWRPRDNCSACVDKLLLFDISKRFHIFFELRFRAVTASSSHLTCWRHKPVNVCHRVNRESGNKKFFFLTQQSNTGQGRLIHEVSRSLSLSLSLLHTHTESVGLLWTSDRPVAETSTWQHKTRVRHLYPWRDSNPQCLAIGIGGSKPYPDRTTVFFTVGGGVIFFVLRWKIDFQGGWLKQVGGVAVNFFRTVGCKVKSYLLTAFIFPFRSGGSRQNSVQPVTPWRRFISINFCSSWARSQIAKRDC